MDYYTVSKHSRNTSIRIKKRPFMKLIETCLKYKTDYMNGIKYVLEAIKNASIGDYHIHHNDYIIKDYRKTTPSIKSFLDEHGGVRMNADELSAALNDYDDMINANKTIMDDRITAYSTGMKTINIMLIIAIISVISITIVII